MQTVLLPKRAAGMSILGNIRGDPGTATALLLPTTAPQTLELALAEVTAEVLTVVAEALAVETAEAFRPHTILSQHRDAKRASIFRAFQLRNSSFSLVL